MKKNILLLFLIFLIYNCGNKEDVKEISPGHTVTIESGALKVIFADNTGFGEHRAWYNGVAHLSHKADTTNFFRQNVAGLNFEHIFDGQKWWEPREALFEPRSSFMSIKKISRKTVELHQPPSELHKLESWTRFTVADDYYVDMEFTCIPRAETFDRGYIGLFWASYIYTNVNKEYYFIGHKPGEEKKVWVRYETPQHNIKSTVKYENEKRDITFIDEHPPRLYSNYSDYVYSYPFYYGKRGGMVYMIMFDQAGPVRFSHSPSGGGRLGDGNTPAWDFQYIIYDYKVNEKYSFKARVVYKPFINREDVISEYEKWSGKNIGHP